MPFQRVPSAIPELNKIQDSLVTTFREIAERPFGRDTVLVEDIALTTSDVAVPHGLGRPVRGWLIVKSNAGVFPYTVTAHSNPDQFINLRAASSVTVSLLFF